MMTKRKPPNLRSACGIPCRIAAVCLALFGAAAAAQTKKPVERQIARAAAVIATNRLAADVKDETGRLLLQLARKLDPNDEAALLAAALIERSIPPEPVKTATTEDKLAEMLVKRAGYLWGRLLPKNAKLGPLCLLYLKMAERFRPTSKSVLLGQMKLRVRGYDGKLEDLLEGSLDVEDIFNKPTPPKFTPLLKLEKVDTDFAKYAAAIATNRLAADPKDATGLMFLRLVCCLEPENNVALLALAMLERGKRPAPVETRVPQDKLVAVAISRADRLLARALQKKGAMAALCLLYYKFAERFQPTNRSVLIGLTKLKVAGVDGELDDLLAKGSNQFAVEPPTVAKVEPSPKTQPRPPRARRSNPLPRAKSSTKSSRDLSP